MRGETTVAVLGNNVFGAVDDRDAVVTVMSVVSKMLQNEKSLGSYLLIDSPIKSNILSSEVKPVTE